VHDELLAGAAALVGVVLAGEDEGLDDALAVDGLGDLLGVLGDDREEIGEQLALERGEVLRDVGDGPVRVVGAIDRLVARDGDRRVAVRRAVGDRRLGARPVLLLGGGQAACRIVSLVRYLSPSSSLRW
jgi:hypothetical protein